MKEERSRLPVSAKSKAKWLESPHGRTVVAILLGGLSLSAVAPSLWSADEPASPPIESAAAEPAPTSGETVPPVTVDPVTPTPVDPATPAPAFRPNPEEAVIAPPPMADPAITPPAAATGIPATNPGDAVPEIPSQLFPPGINSLQPGGPPPPPPSPSTVDEVVAPPPDVNLLSYPVTQFHFQYGPAGSKVIPSLPPLEQIIKVQVELGVTKEGITSTARGKRKITIDPTAKARRTYFGDAILQINNAVVEQLNKRGIYGVYVLPEASQVDAATGEDKRGKKTDLTLIIYVSEVSEVRTVARKVPFRTTDKPLINDKVHARIKDKSPIFATSENKPESSSLLRKELLQNYLSRVNRFPGRRVDAAVNASGEPGKVVLDYLVREQKSWSGYLQTSNTGTSSTGEWRTRAGVELKQLMDLDDILRLEYSTSDFSRYQAASFSYEFAPIFPDILKVRTYFSWGRYSSQDLGFSESEFTGETFTGGASLTWTPVYLKGFPIDLTAGLEWQNISSRNESFNDLFGESSGGSTNFLLAYVGVGTERSTDKFTLAVNAEVQTNLSGIIGTDQGASLAELGRPEVNRSFILAKYNAAYSVYLEPIIFRKAWDEQKVWWKSTRAHELFFSFRGQATLSDSRLIPQLQYVAGGFNSVRGYPESFVVGDSAYVGTAEYRFHLPRALKPADQKKSPVKDNGNVAAADAPPADPPKEKKFNFIPPTIGTPPDWDLIFRIFADAGQTFDNRTVSFAERDRTLIAVGAGMELQILKPAYISLRADWGYALHSETEQVNEPVSSGDSRFHFSATIAF